MRKERFITFLEDNVLSMFTGSEIIGEEESGPRDACVALGSGGTLLVKFSRNDTSRFIIKRVQPFKAFEVQLKGLGFGFVEILSSCPTNWKMTPQEAHERVRNEMIPVYPLGVFKDITAQGEK